MAMADSLLGDPDKLRIMSQNAQKMAVTDACSRIYDIMTEVLAGKLG